MAQVCLVTRSSRGLGRAIVEAGLAHFKVADLTRPDWVHYLDYLNKVAP
jgi:NAD(P)-dependent dehydrogenase (short-subunit alcohol dehydrogenase family)